MSRPRLLSRDTSADRSRLRRPSAHVNNNNYYWPLEHQALVLCLAVSSAASEKRFSRFRAGLIARPNRAKLSKWMFRNWRFKVQTHSCCNKLWCIYMLVRTSCICRCLQMQNSCRSHVRYDIGPKDYDIRPQGRPLNVKLGTRCAMGKVWGKPNEENRGQL